MSRWLRLLAVALLLEGSAALAQTIDLNTASKDELESLPGIGPKLAQDIIDNRPYHSVEDLREVSGFGGARFERLRELVSVGDAPASAPGTPRNPAPSAPVTVWEVPAGMVPLVCWRCGEHFCVEAGTATGVCPYCGVQWGLRQGATP